ncbi:MAG: gliding motility-associated ABC transporter permease subunit GldF [Bacteroidetes bacterium]|nr:MAG: gliding motility-associated ABC transporter permease subunit GldF [Bacteroidota bacterium]
MHNVITIFRKEVATFLNSLIGYLVISVFLTGVGLFFWVFPQNVIESTYASMEPLFTFGPLFFLFLVPAITMRAFSDEIRTGTIELLMTKPLTDWEIIMGKYLATAFLVLFSLLPTLIYYFTVYWLGNPVGNIDTGATVGAYIGLFFLGCIFGAIGMFSSALSSNQIVAFILGVFLCFFFFLGFDFLADIPAMEGINRWLLSLSINEHYQSISRGVIDTRDALYFLTFVCIALIATKISLAEKRGG